MKQFRGWFMALALLLPPALFAAEARLSLPPDSLHQWYPPQAERQVWLHTMFKLGRAMQATGEYAALGDEVRLAEWAERFVTLYRRLGEMVPEWQDELELTWAERLLKAARAGDGDAAGRALQKIGVSCGSCHNEYRPAVTLLLRTPDWSTQRVEYAETLEEVPYDEVMAELSHHLNRVQIGLLDGATERAGGALAKLRTRLDDLGEHCAACHDDPYPRERILGGADETLDRLAAAVADSDTARAGEALGEIGVAVCARCHSIHRTTARLRQAVEPAPRPGR